MTFSESVSLAELARQYSVDPYPLEQVAARFPCRISRHYAGLIETVGDPIWLQAVPSLAELEDLEQSPDPLDEVRLSPVPGVIHRYPDRVVLLVSNHCATYCRFCMRKRQVGEGDAAVCLADAVAYIRSMPGVRDVVLSGGDPLMLSDERLGEILAALRQIPHVDVIRIGSRIPVTDPARITPALCRLLACFKPLYLNTHFNHPRELTPESTKACSMLADAGVCLGNQSVLLKGVNDSVEVLQDLCRGLLRIRVRPYYLHQMDLVRGTAHFRTGLDVGRQLIGALRGRVSGMAIPHFVVDLPGGKGKVPLLPDSLQKVSDGWLIRTVDGDPVRYQDPAVQGC